MTTPIAAWKNKRTVLAAAIALFALIARDARAGTANSSFTVSGTVSANCTISTSGIAFAYDPVVGNATTDARNSGSVTIACTKGSSPSIALDAGLHAGAAAGAPRAMLLSVGGISYYLGYDIYWPGTSTSWTTATPYVPSAPPSKAARTFNMDGIAFKGQDVPPGTYMDTVNATVNF
jgi:spore coat protein U-like protein